MSRSMLFSTIAMAGLLVASKSAHAQVIVVQPTNPVKDAETQAKNVITDWYQAYLNRKPSDKEMATHMTKLRGGTNPGLIQAAILSGPEYYKKNGNKNAPFVTALFNDVLSKKIQAADANFMAAQLTTMNRTDFVIEFLKSAQNPFGQ